MDREIRSLILELVDPLDVALNIGVDVRKKGSHYFCTCLNPKHDDNRPTNCVITDRGYYCFACGDHGDVFKMVKNFYAKEGEFITFEKAEKIVADMVGVDISKSASNTEDTKSSYIPFTSAELAMIGIKTQFTCPTAELVSESDWDPGDVNSKYLYKKVKSEFTKVKKERSPLVVLYNENPGAFFFLVERKIKERRKLLERALSDFTDRDSEKADILFDIFEEDCSLDKNILIELKNIYQEKILELDKLQEKLEQKRQA